MRRTTWNFWCQLPTPSRKSDGSTRERVQDLERVVREPGGMAGAQRDPRLDRVDTASARVALPSFDSSRIERSGPTPTTVREQAADQPETAEDEVAAVVDVELLERGQHEHHVDAERQQEHQEPVDRFGRGIGLEDEVLVHQEARAAAPAQAADEFGEHRGLGVCEVEREVVERPPGEVRALVLAVRRAEVRQEQAERLEPVDERFQPAVRVDVGERRIELRRAIGEPARQRRAVAGGRWRGRPGR